MTPVDVKRLAEDERRDLADFLETLDPDQWQAQSLCTEWTVHEVVAHLISYEELLIANDVRAHHCPPQRNP